MANKTAQIVDEAKFVEKISKILFGKIDEIKFTPDRLNGGATSRAVITRADLARWLEADIDPGQLQYILEASSDDRGMNLIGSACVLAGIADITKTGWANRSPILVLYKTAS